jgi:hypothetical protein
MKNLPTDRTVRAEFANEVIQIITTLASKALRLQAAPFVDQDHDQARAVTVFPMHWRPRPLSDTGTNSKKPHYPI